MKKNFWDRTAKIYNRFMSKDTKAYNQMYTMIYPIVLHKTVLELATGTGLIAKNIVRYANHIEATDLSENMIKQAKLGIHSEKLHFSVQDMFCLPYADHSFDVVIISNALHIVENPQKALTEIYRVLKDDGTLIAPTFTHADNNFHRKVKIFFMKIAGFPQYSKWSNEEYLDFLKNNGWKVEKSKVLNASFPLTYAECVKSNIHSITEENSNEV